MTPPASDSANGRPTLHRSVVTGGAGFIGSHVADRLLELGDEVFVVDNLASGREERIPDDAEFVHLDIRDAAALNDLARRVRPTRWFHLAAQADVRVSVTDPAADADVNVLGTINVLEAARVTDAPVVFSSTGGAIYGPDVVIPTPEAAAAEPLSPYGAAKLAAEGYVRMHGQLYGLRHGILRYANVYGPRQDPHGEAGVVAIFAGRIAEERPATAYGDGLQTRDYVYVHDVVDATVAMADAALRSDTVPLVNIGTGRETSVLDLWSSMLRIAQADLAVEHAPPRAGELQRSALDPTRARQLLSVSLDTPLAEGLAATLQWLHAPR